MIAAFSRHRWGVLGALVGLAIAGALWGVRQPAVAALREHPYFAITQLEISGYGPALTAADVRAWLGIDGRATVWQATPARVRARLLAHPRIAFATVRRSFPDRLEVVIRERRPQAIAVLDDLFYVDRSGALFGPLDELDSRDYPIITGLDGASPAPGERNWLLRRVLRLLRRCDRGPCIGELSEVHVESARGVVVYPAEPRLGVVLGWGSWTAKLERSARALRAWPGGAERLIEVDARFRNQVVLTTRPVPVPNPPPAAVRRGVENARRPQRAPRRRAPLTPVFPRAGVEVKA